MDCAQDEDCLGERYCLRKSCHDPCQDGSVCPGSRRCEQGRCVEPERCLFAQDCDGDRVCAAGTCVEPCRDDDDCPGTQLCAAESGLCREGPSCSEQRDCLAGRVCVAGSCQEPCRADADCPGTRRCELLLGTCPEAEVCLVAEDCDHGRRCHLGRCADICGPARPCPGTLSCNAAQVCDEPERCRQDDDCLGQRLCMGSRCADPCLSDDGCSGAQTCEEASGMCREPVRCNMDADCLGLRTCGPDRRCLEPECETSEECPGVCLDGRCAARAPAACVVDGNCPEPQTCIPLGACALDRACSRDADCPTGSPRCDVRTGRCHGCLSDVDCARSESCREGRCRAAGGCQLDEDCPGAGRCRDSQCTPSPGCAADRFDELPEPAGLPLRVHTGLMLCDGETDSYRVRTLPGEGLRAVLRHSPAAGDLFLRLLEVAASPVLLRSSDTLLGVELVGVDAGPAARELELVVRGRTGFHVPYTLELTSLTPADCLPDEHELLFANDDQAHATPARPGSQELVLCPGDEDWFSLELAAGSQLVVRLEGERSLAELLHASLLDEAGQLLAQAEPEMVGSLRLALHPERSRRAFLRLRHLQQGQRIPLRLSVSAQAAADAESLACAEAPNLLSGAPRIFPGVLPVSRFALSCHRSVQADHVARFELGAQALVSLRVLGGSSFELRRTCDDEATGFACTAAADPAVEDLLLEPGSWFVIWNAPSGAATEVLLEARQLCAQDGDCPEEQRCNGGLCHPACRDDGECGGARTCEPVGGHCLEPERCAGPEDCNGLRSCRYDGSCFVAQCARHADCAVGLCIEGSCAEPGYAGCRSDEDCSPPLRCAGFGTCLPAGPCSRDADCPEGAARCDLLTGVCRVCLADDDCEPAEVCIEGRCAFSGSCEEIGLCPGQRVCDGGICRVAQGCPGDRFDRLEQPTLLGPQGYEG
ncbi:MAG: hypothetical protein FJ125_06910, partial [Deltaproteobacteria bacterium]|nr:hypothetical protein [Deltaproteobacteria bacterium]